MTSYDWSNPATFNELKVDSSKGKTEITIDLIWTCPVCHAAHFDKLTFASNSRQQEPWSLQPDVVTLRLNGHCPEQFVVHSVWRQT